MLLAADDAQKSSAEHLEDFPVWKCWSCPPAIDISSNEQRPLSHWPGAPGPYLSARAPFPPTASQKPTVVSSTFLETVGKGVSPVQGTIGPVRGKA